MFCPPHQVLFAARTAYPACGPGRRDTSFRSLAGYSRPLFQSRSKSKPSLPSLAAQARTERAFLIDALKATGLILSTDARTYLARGKDGQNGS